MIPQDPSLFHRTLLENIYYGNHSVILDSQDQESRAKDGVLLVIEAAKKAHAHEFMKPYPRVIIHLLANVALSFRADSAKELPLRVLF